MSHGPVSEAVVCFGGAFFKPEVTQGCIPFEVTTRINPNAETIAAILEARQLMSNHDAMSYSVEDALKKLK